MARQALYFPTIRVPDNDWFNRVLLYWDVVGAIVPAQLHENYKQLGWRMGNYVDFNLVRLISPDQYVWDRDDFRDEFLATIRELPDLEARRQAFAGGKRRLLHTGKADGGLLEQLEREQLAGVLGGVEWEVWWEVEAEVARRYMAALARLVASAERGQQRIMDPVTDRAEDLEALGLIERTVARPAAGAGVGGGASHVAVATARTEMLNVALPAFSGPVSAFDLAKFKEKHGELLVDLRIHIEQRVIEIAREDDRGIREALRAKAYDELQGKLDEVTKYLDSTGWKTDRKGATFNITTTVARVVGEGITNPWSLLTTAPKAAKTIGDMFKKPDPAQAGPLAYAVVASKQFDPAPS